MVDLEATKDGEIVDGGQATGVSYQIGSGQLVPGIDEAVTGLSAGESATFRTTLLGTNAGEEVDCQVTVSAVKEQQLPELDDEFAQTASEFDTLDELRADLHEQAARVKRIEQAIRRPRRGARQAAGDGGRGPVAGGHRGYPDRGTSQRRPRR